MAHLLDLPEIYDWTSVDWSLVPQSAGVIHRATDWRTGQAVVANLVENWEIMRQRNFRYRLMFQRVVSWIAIDTQALRMIAAVEAVGGLRQGEAVELDLENTNGSMISWWDALRWFQVLEEYGVRCGSYENLSERFSGGELVRTHPVVAQRPQRLACWSDSNWIGDDGPAWSRQYDCSQSSPGFSTICKNYLIRPDVADRLTGYTTLDIIPREAWLPYAQESWTTSPPFEPASEKNNIAIHWPGGSASLGRSDPYLYVARIHDEHRRRDNDGNPNIAYNFVVVQDGRIFEGRGWDYRCAANGSQPVNVPSVAIQLATDPTDPVTQEQIDSVRFLVEATRQRCVNINPQSGPKGDGFTGHRDLFGTSCPGDPLYAMTHNGTFEPQEEPPPPPPQGDNDLIANPFLITPDGAIWYTNDGVWRRHIMDFLDLRSMMVQTRYITVEEGWTGNPVLTDDQLRARCGPLGANEHIKYFGRDVDSVGVAGPQGPAGEAPHGTFPATVTL